MIRFDILFANFARRGLVRVGVVSTRVAEIGQDQRASLNPMPRNLLLSVLGYVFS